jgi:3D (Asp-Asp-Asp) domain-containing protein
MKRGKMRSLIYFVVIGLLLLLIGCGKQDNSLEVTATAYTSSPTETDSTPSLTAWGDTLRPGIKAIAVSRDLIKIGLSHGVEVSIDGLNGKYIVLDKMNKRWKRKIDIYMGLDVKKAKKWGKKKVVIHWPKKTL